MTADITVRKEGPGHILSQEALAFLIHLHRTFNDRRMQLLEERAKRQARIDGGEVPTFLPQTAAIRSGDWTVRPVGGDLQDRRVEITGPVERKMMINALNSGAKTFMADFEDSNTPSWNNIMDGQVNAFDAVRDNLRHETKDKVYEVGPEPAVLLIRPRGWHLDELNIEVDGRPMAASLVDFGLYFFHNARALIDRGSGPYFYLPKLESHLEARLWDDVFTESERWLAIEHGSIKATVLIETILAAFEMDEILYELRDHSAGLNAGRWDYIFSIIKKFRNDPTRVLPDRAQITMTVPFMKAYTDLLVATCHKRGAHAMGGMAAFIPNRRDPDVTARALEKVTADKRREANDGCDGTWVAHPDLVPVAQAEFDAVLGDRPNQVVRHRLDVDVAAADLLTTTVDGGTITEAGIRTNINVGILYIASWLRGNGAAALYNLMEDAATAEISRSQIWQWVRTGSRTDDGQEITAERIREIATEEMALIREMTGDQFAAGRYDEAHDLFLDVALSDEFIEFLTLPAYQRIEGAI